MTRSFRPTAQTIAVVALVVATTALMVSIIQTNLAREDAREARRTSSTLVEGLARKVFLDTDFDSVTVSNIGTLPIHDVTLYRADDQGLPQAVYEFEASVPGCSSFRWEGSVKTPMAVGFRVVDEGLWLLSNAGGLTPLESVPPVETSPRSWNLQVSPIRLCS